MQFISPDFTSVQFASGRLSIGDADVVTVAAGADTAVDDSQLPTGSLTLTAGAGNQRLPRDDEWRHGPAGRVAVLQ